MAKIATRNAYVYDIKMIRAGSPEVITLVSGNYIITETATTTIEE